MNYTKVFYWLSVADNAKVMFVVFVTIFTIISGIATICYFMNSEDEVAQKMSRKWMWYGYPFMIFFWFLFVLTPSKKDALLIIAGGQTLNFLTTDTVAKQIPRELSSFVVSELKNMAAEAKVDLNINSQKDKLLEKAKSMTAAELMSEMKKDSTFAKVILDK